MSTTPLNALRAFEAVARLGSFKAAADALFVTQSAISHQIRHVEDWLGKPLFAREGNRTRLLDEGAELAASLSIAFGEIDSACRRARNRGGTRTLVIAAIPSVAMCWLIPRLSRFRAEHPEIEFRIVYAMHGRDIDFDAVHLAFVFAPQPPRLPGINTTLFLTGESAPVCAPGLAQRLGPGPWSAAAIAGLGLLHDGDISGWQTWLRERGQDPGRIAGATFEDFNLLRAAALSGQGVALCPLAMIQPDLEAGNLVRLSDQTMSYGSDYYLLSTLNAPAGLVRPVALFRDWALRESAPARPAAAP